MSSYKAINNTERLGDEYENRASVLRYPFGSMDLYWLENYLSGVASSRRAVVAMRLLETLMAHTVLHEDPFMEEAVTVLHGCISDKQLAQVNPAVSGAFLVVQQVFKDICWTAKFPAARAEDRPGILKNTETQTRHIAKKIQEYGPGGGGSGTLHFGPAVPIAVNVALERLRVLRGEMDNAEHFTDLMNALKTLFFAVSVRSGISPQGFKPPYTTFVCCTGCACYGQLRNSYTVFLHHVERAKIIDCAVIAAVNYDDDLMHDIVSELQQSLEKDYLETAYMGEIARFVHNGKFFYCRMALFEALGMISGLQSVAQQTSVAVAAAAAAGGGGGAAGGAAATGAELEAEYLFSDRSLYLDRLQLMLVSVREVIAPLRDMGHVYPLLDDAMVHANTLYGDIPAGGGGGGGGGGGQLVVSRAAGAAAAPMTSISLEELAALRESVATVFAALSEPEYHLAVHSRDGFVGKPATMRCASAACPGRIKDLLKCSGCDVTYYCSTECQKADWDRHKPFCQEMESRRGAPAVVEAVATEFCTFRPGM